MHILFQHQFDLPVWRVIPSGSSKISWVVEIRDAKERKVYYFYVDSNRNIRELNTNLNWWSGVEAVSGPLIIFHQYLQQDLPIHAGVSMFQAEKDTFLWSNKFVRYISSSSGSISVISIAGSTEHKFCLHPETGEETLPIKDLFEDSFPITTFIAQDQPYFNDISDLITRHTHLIPVKGCEYLEDDEHLVISYYVMNQSLLENYLLVTDLNGEDCLHTCLGSGLAGLATGTFTVSDGFLSFVKDKREYFIINLN